MKIGTKPGLVAALAVLGATAGPAIAAPVEVNVRIEGATTTHFEGQVSTDARSTLLGSDQAQHPCDGTNKGAPAPTPTAGAALATAAEAAPFSYSLSWFGGQTEDFFLDSAAGETPDFGTSGTFWGFWVDGEPASTGMCGALLHQGEEILWAVATGSERLLKLTGLSAGAQRGDTVTLAVTDRASGDPVPGALVGNTETGADGKATIPLTQTGIATFKATKAGTIRSNAVSIAVTERGVAPVAGAPADRVAPLARLLGIADRHVFAKGKGPRTVRAKVTDASGLAAVKLRLTRRTGGRCFYFSGRRTALERTRCGRSFFFKVGESPDVSYLLPERLGPGRYVLDLAAVDRAGNRSVLVRGSTRVVFTVR